MRELFLMFDKMCAYCRWFALNYTTVDTLLHVVYQLVAMSIIVRGTHLTEKWMRWLLKVSGMGCTLEDMLADLHGLAKRLLLLILYP